MPNMAMQASAQAGLIKPYVNSWSSKGLQGTPRDSEGLQGTPRGSKGLQGTPRDSKGLQGTPKDSKGLQGTPRDSKGPQGGVPWSPLEAVHIRPIRPACAEACIRPKSAVQLASASSFS